MSTFSIQDACDTCNQGKEVLNWVAPIVSAVEELDMAIQVFLADRSVDKMQAVTVASRHLSQLLNGCQPEQVPIADNRDFCAEARIARGMLTAPMLPSLAQMMGAA